MSREPVAEAFAGLRRAAASADGGDDAHIADAVQVHASRLGRAELLRLVWGLTRHLAEDARLIDRLVGSLERVAGTGSAERVSRAIDGDETGVG